MWRIVDYVVFVIEFFLPTTPPQKSLLGFSFKPSIDGQFVCCFFFSYLIHFERTFRL